ncbi:MAG: hypothetical protein KGJ86_19460 [Chloroflexota bacterium]|nr:hypothetical protein [Chloroflexota bacterium]
MLTVLLLVIFGACFGAGIVFHLGWLVVVGMLIVPIAIVVGIYRGTSGSGSEHQLAP